MFLTASPDQDFSAILEFAGIFFCWFFDQQNCGLLDELNSLICFSLTLGVDSNSASFQNTVRKENHILVSII